MANPKAKARRGRPIVQQKPLEVLGRRVSSADLDRITRAATVNSTTISCLIDQAVAQYAREIGVSAPPPDRTA